MKAVSKSFHFLGSVYFAILLIASVALLAIFGTFIESATSSHRFAAVFTYQNPIFIALLWGFFINILFAALRRYPFKLVHIPFLITHLGLLMILGGTLLKSYIGIQGNMRIVEGSASQEISLPDTYAIAIESRQKASPTNIISDTNFFELKKDWKGSFMPKIKTVGASQSSSHQSGHENLAIELVSYSPHGEESLELWLKGSHAHVAGLRPIPINNWDVDSLHLTSTHIMGNKARVFEATEPWEFVAYRAHDVDSLAKDLYLKNLDIAFLSTTDNKEISRVSLSELLQRTHHIDGLTIDGQLNFNFSNKMGNIEAKLCINISSDKEAKETVEISLSDCENSPCHNYSYSFLGRAPWIIEVKKQPMIAFIGNREDKEYVLAFDPYGNIKTSSYKPKELSSIIVYDKAYGGYAIQAPIDTLNKSQSVREEKQQQALHTQCKEAGQDSHLLPPPLVMLQKACKKAGASFEDISVQFLAVWDENRGWLYPESRRLPTNIAAVMEKMEWESPALLQGAHLTSILMAPLEKLLASFPFDSKSAMAYINEKFSSFVHAIGEEAMSPKDIESVFTSLTQQAFFLADQQAEQLALSEAYPQSASATAHLFSAYLRAYGIHYRSLLSQMPIAKSSKDTYIEVPITKAVKAAAASNKLEDNTPIVTIRFKEGAQSETITLKYDRFAAGLKWPVLGGRYLVRFQPIFVSIPYRVRLHDAREIKYPNSNQTYSYESDIIVTGETGTSVEKTLSMNKVYEAEGGYRFYLSNIAPGDESAVQAVQLVVNHDPAKYMLTYPGSLILAIGIVLLFWLKRTKGQRI